jgi:two-component system CheB/CheR fusion protein
VSPERLRRFFVKTDTGYQISKMIRDMCVVAKQNVVKDPPFSNLDLISCRNLLIYMGPTLQNRVIPTFHYALRPNGLLLLGSSETIGSHSDLFSLTDKKHKIYAKKSTPARLPADFGAPEYGPQPTVERKAEPHRHTGIDLEREADRIVLEKYAPAGVIIDEHMNILQFRGQTGRYLEPAPGQASLSLLRLAKRGLVFDIRAALHRAKREGQSVRKEGIRVGHNGGQLEVSLEVVPILGDENEEAHYLVIFEESADRPADSAAAPSKSAKAGAAKSAKSDVNKELEDALNDLAQTKETLRTIIEQHEATNEELRAANEEIQSSNEELQSTNEELETAKEELQSTNEELTTLNEELENRNAELSRIINDYNNLLASVDMPIIMFDVDRKIRLFTPMATTVFNLIPADQGRHIGALSLSGQIPGLEQKVEEAIDQLTTKDEEICLSNNRWYTMRLRPYKTAANRIEGAVLALVDITDAKLAKERDLEKKDLRRSLAVAEAVLATLTRPFLVLDPALRIVSANRAFLDTFRLSHDEAKQQSLGELDGGAWNTAEFRQRLEELTLHGAAFQSYAVKQDFPRVGRKTVLVSGQRLNLGSDPLNLVLLTMEEVTDDPRPGAGQGDSAGPR